MDSREELHDEWKNGCLVGIAQPLTWPYINSQTHLSMMALDKPDVVILDTPRSGGLAEKREIQTLKGLDKGCTHIAYLDGDMLYPRNALRDMINLCNEGADLAGIVCYRGAPPWDPLIWGISNDQLLTPFKDYVFGDIVDASAVGCGCLTVKASVYEKIPQPWFQVIEMVEGNKIIRRGEDTYFTRKCTNMGLSLKVLTKYDVGHMREIVVDRDIWLMGMLLKKLGSVDAVIKLIKEE